MNPETTIRRLTRQGFTQKEIARRLDRPRGFVHRAQKRMGLQLARHGPRCPTLTQTEERKVLQLLGSGLSITKVANQTRFREWAIRGAARKHGFHRPTCEQALAPETRRAILAEIVAHQNYAADIAEKYGCGYKLVLRMARQALACPQFRRGRTPEPLSSNFPEKWPRSADDFAKLALSISKLSGGNLPPHAESITKFVILACPKIFANAPAEAIATFSLGLTTALKAQHAQDTIEAC
jgi:hypothetical protein